MFVPPLRHPTGYSQHTKKHRKPLESHWKGWQELASPPKREGMVSLEFASVLRGLKAWVPGSFSAVWRKTSYSCWLKSKYIMVVMFLSNIAFCCNGLLTYQFWVDEKKFSIGILISREKKINILLLRPQIIFRQILLAIVCTWSYRHIP